MQGKILAIVTQTNSKNRSFLNKKILGLTSAQWITHRIGNLFEKIIFVEDFGKDKNTTYVCWDNTLATKHTLQYPHDGLRLCCDTFAYIQNTLQSQILDDLVKQGVVLHGRYGLHIDKTAKIASGAEIFAPNVIVGNCNIKTGTTIYPYCFLQDCTIDRDNSIGPFATIRPNTTIGKNCRVGNFVELKNATLQDNVKCAHLSYVGDASIGQNTNVGCGVVFANYDGKDKHFTSVGKNCFLGCNTNLVAPLSLEDDVFVAAGTTVTKDVKEDSFVIGRCKQQTKRR